MGVTASQRVEEAGYQRRFPSLGAALELLKPITWFPPMWAFMCGAVSSGLLGMDQWHLVVGGMILSGPLVCAMSQAINDWHDRHVDAINEPGRPIPSGRVPGRWGLYLAVVWSGLSLGWASLFGPWVAFAALVGIVFAWMYSAPPFRLKMNGWYGNAAVAFSYEGLAWFTGAAILVQGIPDTKILFLAILYSLGAHGIMTLNDFKAIEGDRKMGIRSLPVQLGADRAARVACFVMAIPQGIVMILLFNWGLPLNAAGIAVLIALQVAVMRRYLMNRADLMAEPKRNAALYNATGTTLYVLGMLVSAAGVGTLSGPVS